MKTSVIVDHTVFCEKNYFLIKEINEVVKTSLKEVNIICRNLSSQLIKPECAVINPSEIYAFYGGLLVATSLDGAYTLQRSCVNSRKMFYIWDISFLYQPFKFNEICECLSGLELITRSKEHQRIIKNLSGEESHVLENFKLEDIWNLPKLTSFV